jgi:hypothetical protein
VQDVAAHAVAVTGRARAVPAEDAVHTSKNIEEMWEALGGLSREYLGGIAHNALRTPTCVAELKVFLFGCKTFSSVVKQMLLWHFPRAELALRHEQWPGTGGMCSPASPSLPG